MKQVCEWTRITGKSFYMPLAIDILRKSWIVIVSRICDVYVSSTQRHQPLRMCLIERFSRKCSIYFIAEAKMFFKDIYRINLIRYWINTSQTKHKRIFYPYIYLFKKLICNIKKYKCKNLVFLTINRDLLWYPLRNTNIDINCHCDFPTNGNSK